MVEGMSVVVNVMLSQMSVMSPPPVVFNIILFYFRIPLELWAAFMGLFLVPLFKTLMLLNIGDVYMLKLMKFYYNWSYNLLTSYFNYYLEVINNYITCQYELRQIARPLIHPQRT